MTDRNKMLKAYTDMLESTADKFRGPQFTQAEGEVLLEKLSEVEHHIRIATRLP